MAGHDVQVQKIVLLPRYTSFSGAQTFTTAPINVRAYASAIISLWVGSSIGSSAGLAMQVQESPDLKIWNSISAFGGVPDTEVSSSVTFSMEWVRLSITLAGTSPGFTGWAVGDFVTRVRRK